MLTLSHRFLHCHTDFPDCDTKNALHNVGLKNKIPYKVQTLYSKCLILKEAILGLVYNITFMSNHLLNSKTLKSAKVLNNHTLKTFLATYNTIKSYEPYREI